MAEEFRTRLLTADDLPAWEALWQASPRHLLQHPGFVQAACGAEALRVGAVYRGDDLVLTVPFHLRRGSRLTSWITPPFASFGGPLVSAGEKSERFWRDALGAFADSVPPEALLADLVAPPGVHDLRGLAWKGWQLRPHYNYLTEWTTDGGYEEQAESNVRRQTRKAEREGLEFTTLPAGQTDELLALWSATAGRQSLDAQQSENLLRLAAWLHESKRGWIALVREGPQGPAHAAALIGHDEARCYYLAGASDPDRLGSGAPSMLQLAVLREIERRELPRCYDWVGANTPAIARFKRHFGPRLEVLFAARRTAPRVRLMEGLRAFIRR